MTYGEQSELAYSFLTKYRESDNPEEDLARDRIISSFIESLSENDMHEFQRAYEKLRTHEMFKDQESLQSFENYMYEDVLELKTDVRSEYLYLKDQVADLDNLINSRKQELKGKLLAIGDSRSSEYQKIQDLLGQTGRIEKEVRDQSKTSELIRLAISNSQNTLLNRMFFFGRRDFSRYEWQIRFQDVNVRKYINFGLLPVSDTDKVMSLKATDYDLYMACFKKVIEEYEIIYRIKESVTSNPLMRDRAHIVEEALAYFTKNDYQLFAHILVPQIEGFFRLYMKAMHIQKQTRSIGDVVTEINEKDGFLEYLYFKYDFSDVRNPIAHGDVMNPSKEQAYEILMDVHWIVTKLDSDERDYKKWMSWLEDFSRCDNDKKRRIRTLDYFVHGLEEDERLANLRRFLSHQYTEWISLYGLSEAGKKLYNTLGSEELYSAIWNEATPLKVEEVCEEEFKAFIEDNRQAESKEIKIVSRNDRPLEYEAFVEVMHKHKLCQDVWYEGYRAFVDEQEKVDRQYTEAKQRKAKHERS